MKILFVYQFSTLGGVETVLLSRLEGLPAFGIEAHVWFLADAGGLGTFRRFRDRVHVGGPQALVDFVGTFGPDVLDSIDTEEVLAVPLAARPAPVLIVECHSPYEENLDYLARLSRYPVRAVLVPSPYQRSVVWRKTRQRMPSLVVPNPIGDAFLSEETQPWEVPAWPILAWVGRLDFLKDWEAFLDLGRNLGRDSELWVVGDTRDPSAAQRLYGVAKEKGVLSRLSWFRAVAHADMPSLLTTVRASGGLVVSTSRNESFGMGVAEAMACSNAVLVPRLGPFPDLVSDGTTGCLFERRDLPAAAGIARKILDDAGLRTRLGDTAHQAIKGKHSPAITLPKLVEALRGALAESRSGVFEAQWYTSPAR